MKRMANGGNEDRHENGITKIGTTNRNRILSARQIFSLFFREKTQNHRQYYSSFGAHCKQNVCIY